MENYKQFRAGQIWESPRGTYYQVEEIGPYVTHRQALSGKRKQAILRKVAIGKGRRTKRDYDDVFGWVFISPAMTAEIRENIESLKSNLNEEHQNVPS